MPVSAATAASVAFTAFVVRWVYLLLCSQVVIPRLRILDTCIGCKYGCRLVLMIPMRLSRNGHILRVYRCCLLLALSLSRSTLLNVNLTVSLHYARSESISVRLMPPDGWRKRVEQLGLRFQLRVRESKVPILEVVVGRGIAGEKCDN